MRQSPPTSACEDTITGKVSIESETMLPVQTTREESANRDADKSLGSGTDGTDTLAACVGHGDPWVLHAKNLRQD